MKNFTLAEVLIVLVIVGVVSALTIPILFNEYQKKTLPMKLKKNYAIWSQVIRMSEDENGGIDSWNYNLSWEDFNNKYILPYLKNVSKIPSNTPYCSNIKSLSKTSTGLLHFQSPCRSGKAYILADGTTFVIYTLPGEVGFADMELIVDLNGFSGPNMAGRDIFFYGISNGDPKRFDLLDEKMEWAHNKNIANTKEEAKNYCKWASGYYAGSKCGYAIKMNNWQLPENYLK